MLSSKCLMCGFAFVFSSWFTVSTCGNVESGRSSLAIRKQRPHIVSREANETVRVSVAPFGTQ